MKSKEVSWQIISIFCLYIYTFESDLSNTNAKVEIVKLIIAFMVIHFRPSQRNIKSIPIVLSFVLKHRLQGWSFFKMFLPSFWLVVMLKSRVDSQISTW